MSEIISRIPSHYVDEINGCAQIMIPYRQTMTLFNKNGIQFNHNNNQYDFINEYLQNPMKYSFPYYNIANHIRRQGWFGKTNVTNQILNFDEPYISIVDGVAIERYALLDKNEALIMTKVLPYELEDNSEYSNKYKTMTREELDNIFKPSNENEKVFIATTTCDIYHSETMGYHDEKKFLEDQKRKYEEQLEHCGNNYLSKDTIEFLERKINEMTLDDLRNLPLPPSIYLIKMDGKNIKIQLIYSELIRTNEYKVTIKNIPLNKYVLEQFKFMAPNIVELKEPKISLRLNPGITKEEIENAKKMVLSMRNQ